MDGNPHADRRSCADRYDDMYRAARLGPFGSVGKGRTPMAQGLPCSLHALRPTARNARLIGVFEGQSFTPAVDFFDHARPLPSQTPLCARRIPSGLPRLIRAGAAYFNIARDLLIERHFETLSQRGWRLGHTVCTIATGASLTR